MTISRWRRLLDMSPREILYRGRQAAQARCDGLRAARGAGYPDRLRFLACLRPGIGPEMDEARHRARAGDREGALQTWALGRRVAPLSLSLEERSVRATRLGERLPAVRARVLAAADAALDGQVRLFGHFPITLEDPPDWHRDPLNGQLWPRLYRTAIDYMPGNLIGDVKYVWELSRHAHFLALAQAAVLTTDERYCALLARQMASWMAQNPPGVGVHWTSSLEVALRSLAWIWSLHLASDRPGFSRAAQLDGAVALWFSARHLSRYLSVYSDPYNHLMGESLALWTIAIAHPEFPKAPRWQRLGEHHLTEGFQRQIRPDGGQVEQSLSYHRFVLEMALLALATAEQTGHKLSASMHRCVESAAAYAMHLTGPNGLLPDLGDGDDARVLPLAERHSQDARGWLALAAVLCGRPDMKRTAGAPSEELIWLLGDAGLARWDALPAADSPPDLSAFPNTGTAVIRSGAGHALVFDAGPHGIGHGGHGHADALSIQLAIFGENVLIDPGTFQYNASGPWRELFRTAAAHNTVIVDDSEPAVTACPLSWRRQVHGRLERWRQDADVAFLEGSHQGYHTLSDPVSFRRRIWFCPPGYWVLQDRLDGREEHAFEWLFHLAAGAEGDLEPDGAAHIQTAGGRSLWLIPLNGEGIDTEIVNGQLSPPLGWVSPRYGERVAAPVVRFRLRARAPVSLHFLLFPVPDHAFSRRPNVQWLPARRAGQCVSPAEAGGAMIDADGSRSLHLFRHEAGGPVEVEGWETDAEAAVIHLDGSDEGGVWMLDGTYVSRNPSASYSPAPQRPLACLEPRR